MDLRERIAAACDAGDATREQIAERFSVSVSWIRDFMKQRRETGSIAAKPYGGGRAALFDEAAGVDCEPSTVFRVLKKMGITRKRVASGVGIGWTRVEGSAKRLDRGVQECRPGAPDFP